MNNSRARTVAFLGVAFALVFVFLMIETFALSAVLGNLTPAALTLPLAAAISVTGKPWRMFVGGTLLGLSSFFLAILISNPIFLNPLISILPRLLTGVVAYFVALLFKTIFKNKNLFWSEIFPNAVAGAFFVLTNTVLVITMLTIFNESTLAAVLATILSINFVAEIVSGIILTPIFARVINLVERRGENK